MRQNRAGDHAAAATSRAARSAGQGQPTPGPRNAQDPATRQGARATDRTDPCAVPAVRCCADRQIPATAAPPPQPPQAQPVRRRPATAPPTCTAGCQEAREAEDSSTVSRSSSSRSSSSRCWPAVWQVQSSTPATAPTASSSTLRNALCKTASPSPTVSTRHFSGSTSPATTPTSPSPPPGTAFRTRPG